MSARGPGRGAAVAGLGWWTRRGLHAQLIIAGAVLLAATVLVGTLINIAQRREEILEDARANTSTLAVNIALTAIDMIVAERYDDLEALLERSARFQSVRSILAVDAHGALLGFVVREADGEPQARYRAPARIERPQDPGRRHVHEDLAARRLIVWQPVSTTDLIAWVRIEASLEPAFAARTRVLQQNLAAGAGAIAVDVLLLLLILSGPRRSVRGAIAFAGRLADAKGSTLQVRPTALEVDTLVRALNDASRMLHEREQALQKANAELLGKERLATLGQMAATVSHELRNPMGTIRNAVTLLQRRLREREPEVEQALQRLVRSTERCDRIIEDMLDYARSQPVHQVRTPLDGYLSSELAHVAPPPGVTIDARLAAPGLAVMLDRERFRSVIGNLCDNAFHAIEQAGERSTRALVVATRPVGGQAEITFTDTGCGMSREALDSAFVPLFSTKSFGVGLGLPLVRQILEQHGGEVEIRSDEGRGTCVLLRLRAACE